MARPGNGEELLSVRGHGGEDLVGSIGGHKVVFISVTDENGDALDSRCGIYGSDSGGVITGAFLNPVTDQLTSGKSQGAKPLLRLIADDRIEIRKGR